MYLIRLRLKQAITKWRLARAGEKVSKQIKDSSLIWAILSLLVKIIILGIGVMIILFPFYYMLAGSLMSPEEIEDTNNIHLWPKHLQWSNFTKAFVSGYWSALLFTGSITFVSIILKIFITLLMGYAFSLKKWRGKKALWWLFLMIMMLPEVALMAGQFRVVTQLQWREGTMMMAAMILPFIASVFSAMMFRNAFEAIPLRIKEAAFVDGASEIKFFFKVAIPMVTPTIWTVGILTAFAAWNSYMWPALLLSGAGSDKQVMSTWVFTTGLPDDPNDNRLLMEVRLAAAVIAIIPMFIVYFAMRGRIMRAISRQGSAIKG